MVLLTTSREELLLPNSKISNPHMKRCLTANADMRGRSPVQSISSNLIKDSGRKSQEEILEMAIVDRYNEMNDP